MKFITNNYCIKNWLLTFYEKCITINWMSTNTTNKQIAMIRVFWETISVLFVKKNMILFQMNSIIWKRKYSFKWKVTTNFNCLNSFHVSWELKISFQKVRKTFLQKNAKYNYCNKMNCIYFLKTHSKTSELTTCIYNYNQPAHSVILCKTQLKV